MWNIHPCLEGAELGNVTVQSLCINKLPPKWFHNFQWIWFEIKYRIYLKWNERSCDESILCLQKNRVMPKPPINHTDNLSKCECISEWVIKLLEAWLIGWPAIVIVIGSHKQIIIFAITSETTIGRFAYKWTVLNL